MGKPRIEMRALMDSYGRDAPRAVIVERDELSLQFVRLLGCLTQELQVKHPFWNPVESLLAGIC